MEVLSVHYDESVPPAKERNHSYAMSTALTRLMSDSMS